MPLSTETIRTLLIGCLFFMALLAVLYLRQRRLSWTAYGLLRLGPAGDPAARRWPLPGDPGPPRPKTKLFTLIVRIR